MGCPVLFPGPGPLQCCHYTALQCTGLGGGTLPCRGWHNTLDQLHLPPSPLEWLCSRHSLDSPGPHVAAGFLPAHPLQDPLWGLKVVLAVGNPPRVKASMEHPWRASAFSSPQEEQGPSSTLSLPRSSPRSPAHPFPWLVCCRSRSPEKQMSRTSLIVIGTTQPSSLSPPPKIRLQYLCGISLPAEICLESSAGTEGQPEAGPSWQLFPPATGAEPALLRSQVSLVVLDPRAERGAWIPPLLGAVPTYEPTSPHCLLSHEMSWGQDTLQWAFDGSPLDTAHLNPSPSSFIYGPSSLACLCPDGRRLHMSFLSRTWGFAATSLFTVIFSSDATRTPTLSGRLSAENKTKLFWDVFPFSSYLGAFPCG